MVDKVIVSNRSALQNKYSPAGFQALNSALSALIAADAARNLATQCIWVDDAAQMQQLGGSAPVNEKDQNGYKAAVDAVAARLVPDYIVLLDGPDVVPHIALNNPVPSDGETTVDSDLPYASSGIFSHQVTDNLKITRVVGRIPNVPGATTPSKILDYLKTATTSSSRPATVYQDHFGLTAAAWQGSTQMSLSAVFGKNVNLAVAPSDGPPATDGRLVKPSHFINCHGFTASPQFLGQGGGSWPVAMTSAQVAANAAAGAVIAAECCYGAQLYDPQLFGVADPICIAYLDRGALGFLGSTNIAYGLVASNGQADLLTQYFFSNVIAGASLGRALLQARQQFIGTQSLTDPTNVKTLAQFLLLGDPATVPCLVSKPHTPTRGIIEGDAEIDGVAQRKVRRVMLASIGASIIDAKAVLAGPGQASERAKQKIRAAATQRGYKNPKETIFATSGGSNFLKAADASAVKISVMVLTERQEAPPNVIAVRHLIAHIVDDGVVSVEETVSR